jgi:Flp pilus assembly protein TadG
VNQIPARRSSRTAALGPHQAKAAKRRRRDRGAAAVEFALVMPLLLILVLGIAEFGRAYNIQTTLSAAAREGARVMALESSPSEARSAAIAAAAPAVTLNAGQISVSPSTCTATGTPANATVVVTYPMTFITNFFGASVTLTGKGVMRCNG